jgi:flagellar biosynthesis/type III secretory pathway M-ring protein FliF/YscJ
MDLPLPPGKLQRFVVFTEHWTGALRYVALSLLFLAVYLLILRPVKKHVFTILESTPQPALSGEAAALATMPINGGLSGLPSETGKGVSPEVEEAISLKKKLALKVKSDPQGASRLIQNWLRKSEATR